MGKVSIFTVFKSRKPCLSFFRFIFTLLSSLLNSRIYSSSPSPCGSSEPFIQVLEKEMIYFSNVVVFNSYHMRLLSQCDGQCTPFVNTEQVFKKTFKKQLGDFEGCQQSKEIFLGCSW